MRSAIISGGVDKGSQAINEEMEEDSKDLTHTTRHPPSFPSPHLPVSVFLRDELSPGSPGYDSHFGAAQTTLASDEAPKDVPKWRDPLVYGTSMHRSYPGLPTQLGRSSRSAEYTLVERLGFDAFLMSGLLLFLVACSLLVVRNYHTLLRRSREYPTLVAVAYTSVSPC